MKKKMLICVNLFAGILFMLFACKAQAQNTQVTVSGIKSGKGQFVIFVFNDAKAYEQEKPSKKIIVEKKGIKNGALVFNCNLEPGICGITLLDDENKNGVLDKSLIRMPTEGFGFSNFYMKKMKKPSFVDFKVDVKTIDNKIEIKVKYM